MSPMENSKGLAERIKWLLLLRVVTLSFFFGTATLLRLLNVEGDTHSLYSFLIPLLTAYAISIGSVVLLPRVRNLHRFAHAQVDFDVILITVTIWMTGDFVSPFCFLYTLAIINGAILLFYRGAFQTAAFSTFCYVMLSVAVNAWTFSQPQIKTLLMPLVWNAGSFFAIAVLSGFLARQLCDAENRLRDKQQDYQQLQALKDALLQGVGGGVAVTDVEGRINYYNDQAQQLTTLSLSTVNGKYFKEVFSAVAYDFDGVNAKVATEEFPFNSPQGESKHLRLTVAPLSDTKHLVIGYAIIFEDVTKQRRLEAHAKAEEELQKAREFALPVDYIPEDDSGFRFEGVIGKSAGIENIHRLIQKVAMGSTNVLITGESGTGKELAARAIHFNGERKDKPFIPVNCGAIPENLIESELFGHMRGAFTGAVSDHSGLFKQADQGTIFLDEVGELPLHLQVKLLRVLQDRTFTPIGGSKPIKVDVRVISATNRDLRKETEEGRFREDLFYRLNVVQMVMPPLRSRREDIPVLVHYFLRKFAASHGKNVEEISSGSLYRLMNHNYPGNIRELENIIEHAVAVANSNIVKEEDLPGHLRANVVLAEPVIPIEGSLNGAETFFDKGLSLDDELETHEKCILLAALRRTNGVQKRAAEILGINYRSLRHRLEKYDMAPAKQSFSEELSNG